MEMEARGRAAAAAELRRIPCGAALRVNKKTITILRDKCVQLINALDDKEDALHQVPVASTAGLARDCSQQSASCCVTWRVSARCAHDA
jgi:hypothetical protein